MFDKMIPKATKANKGAIVYLLDWAAFDFNINFQAFAMELMNDPIIEENKCLHGAGVPKSTLFSWFQFVSL